MNHTSTYFEPEGSILPLTNHGLPCMSMGFLIPSTNSASGDNTDTPIVWRGLMVQKAVQQLLFDVDWSKDGHGLDALVIDMPPGTGDVPLTLGQLVHVNGSWFRSLKCASLTSTTVFLRRYNCLNAPRCCTFRRQERHSHAEKGFCACEFSTLF